MKNIDNQLCAYDYDLPKDRIAQEPKERGASRLFVVHKDEKIPSEHSFFSSFVDFLPENALLIANNSKVIPTRLLGQRESGGKIECLILSPLPSLQIENKEQEGTIFSAQADVLIKPAKHARLGSIFSFADHNIMIEVLEKGDFGRHKVRLSWPSLSPFSLSFSTKEALASLESLLEKYGRLPLPPYIQRPDNTQDKSRYQSQFAVHTGSIAAPTASLHFTEETRKKLKEKGIEWQELTLHVGYGTFSPVREEDIHKHDMHPEYLVITEETCKAIAKAKAEKRPIIAIGTTACRSLEALAALQGDYLKPYEGFINIFIRPPFPFRITDGLLTNFHLPKSSLLMLVSALLGRERTLDLYAEAIEESYRFFSYGDAMLIR